MRISYQLYRIVVTLDRAAFDAGYADQPHMTRDFRRWRPAEFTFPPGARGVKLRLVGRGAYRAYRALEPVNKLRVTLRRT